MKRKIIIIPAMMFVLFSCRKEKTTVLPSAYDSQNSGKSARDILTAESYKFLRIEVQYMPGYALDSATLQGAVSFLNELCNKPAGISISQIEIASSNNEILTVDDVKAIEKENRQQYTSGDTISLYVLVTDGYGSLSNNRTASNIGGLSYLNTSFVLFGKAFYSLFGPPDFLPTLQHELGHLLGLVNNGTPMVVFHQDVANGYHCDRNNCLMSQSQPTTMYPTLDANCRNDLRANGGK